MFFLNKNQRQLISKIICEYNLVPFSSFQDFIPSKQFDFLGYPKWDWTTNFCPSMFIETFEGYKHWFTIYDEFDLIAYVSFYYPNNCKEGEPIKVLCDGYGLSLIKIDWIHGHKNLIESVLMYLFYASFVKNKLDSLCDVSSKNLSLSRKLKRIINKITFNIFL